MASGIRGSLSPLSLEATHAWLHGSRVMRKGGMYFTRGLYGEKGKGRALFIIDPDGNETEINTRYLYGTPKRLMK